MAKENAAPRLRRRMQQRRRWIGAGVAALALLLLALAFRPRPLVLELTRTIGGPLSVTVRAEGQTRVKQSYIITAPITGHMRRVVSEPGDPVFAGQVLVLIDPVAPTPLDERDRATTEAQVLAARARWQQAQAAEEVAAAHVESAQREAQREQALLEREATTERSAEQAQLTLQARQEELQAARSATRAAAAELEMAQATLQRFDAPSPTSPADAFEVTAPVDGVLIRVMRRSAGVVQAGQEILEIGDTNKLEVVADVLSADAARLQDGAPAVIEGFGLPWKISGRIARIEPGAFTELSALGIEEQRVNIILELDEHPGLARLGDGFRVEAEMLVWRGEDVLSIPNTAIFRYDDGWATYRIEGGRAHITPVTTGQRSERRVQILEGLSAGDLVVAAPDDRISQGVRVRPAD